MKTLEKLSFPKLENEFLENILRQLANQHNIIQMFFYQTALFRVLTSYYPYRKKYGCTTATTEQMGKKS